MPRPNSDRWRGTLEMLVLRTLAAGPQHGYGIALRLEQLSNAVLQVEEGSLYPALQRLLKKDLLRAEWQVSATGRKVRTYRITRSGVRHMEREVSLFHRMLKGIALVLAPAKS